MVSSQIQQVSDKVEAVTGRVSSMDEQLNKLQSQTNRHDMVIEDMLDTWEELKGREREQISEVEERLKAYREADVAETRHREEQLLALFEVYLEQMTALYRAAAEDPDWAGPVSLMERKIEAQQLKSGITVIDKVGIPVDYDLHTVLDVEETGEEALSGTIREVYVAGYLYNGEVRKKAQVSAWRYTPKASEEPVDDTKDGPAPEEEAQETEPGIFRLL